MSRLGMLEYKPLKKLGLLSIKQVQEAYPILKAVQKAVQVDWRMLAAIWMRETGRMNYPASKGGPFQFDPILDKDYSRTLLERYATPELKQEDIDTLLTDYDFGNFTFSSTLAACLLRHISPNVKYSPLSNKLLDDMFVIDAFYKYNGAAYGSPFRSPYVFSWFNENYKNMVIRGTINGEPVENIDQNPGAFATYKQLVQLFP